MVGKFFSSESLGWDHEENGLDAVGSDYIRTLRNCDVTRVLNGDKDYKITGNELAGTEKALESILNPQRHGLVIIKV